MATPCETAQATYGQLPRIPGANVLDPDLWSDYGDYVTVAGVRAAVIGFDNWYRSPTSSCVVVDGVIISQNPYEDSDWRKRAILAIRIYLLGAGTGVQAVADSLFNADRSLLQAALANESSAAPLAAWLSVADTVGLRGIVDDVLQAGENAALLVQKGLAIGDGEPIVMGAACVALRDWIQQLTAADKRRAAAIAAIAATSSDAAIRAAGLGLQALAMIVAGADTSKLPPAPQPPATLPPGGIAPTLPNWWRDNWPIAAGGGAGVLLLIAVWWRRRHAAATV